MAKMSWDERFEQIAAAVEAGNPPSVSVRELLTWFHAKRRGHVTAFVIADTLERHGLQTKPDFEFQYLDGVVTFMKRPTESDAKSEKVVTPISETEDQTPSIQVEEEPPLTLPITTDPTYRIGKLPAANQPPVFVTPDSPLQEAITLMLQNNFSQLPVMVGQRTVKGLVSWQSIGCRLHFNKPITKVGDCMDRCQVVSSETSIFDAVSEIARHSVVLVRDGVTQLITGIVTTTDLSVQFRQLGEPFLLLSEIENRLRQLLSGCFTKAELKSIKDQNDEAREINHIADLTFGEYLRLVENSDRWNKLGLPLDRKTFIERLDKVRSIRNDVMHFDPDGIDEDDLTILRECASFLQTLAGLNGR